MPLSFEIAGAQLIGARASQEDAFLFSPLGSEGGCLAIVSDGMGGHAAGNVASDLAVRTMNEYLCARYSPEGTAGLLRAGIDQANQAIAKAIHENAALGGMGCTLVGAVVCASGLRWASVGDSHLYLVRGEGIEKLNADHSYGGFLDRMAALGQPLEPEPGCPRHMLLSALTGDDILEVDCPETPVELQAGDRLLLASDGLNTLIEDRIVALCPASRSARECAEGLLAAVTDTGAKYQDNATVVVIEVRDGVHAPASELAPQVPGASEAAAPTATAPAAAFVPSPIHRVSMADSRSVTSAVRKPRVTAVGVALLAIALGAGWLALRPDAPGTSDHGAAGPVPDGSADVVAPAKEGAAVPAPEAMSVQSEPVARPAVSEAAEHGFRDALPGGVAGPEMIWIPAGSFEMGSSRAGASPDERPGHQVRIPRFAIGRFEVTVAEYARYAQATGSEWQRGLASDRYPAVGVRFEDAVAYARWLSAETGFRYRLPSEAEWEYAAGAGARTPFWWGFEATGGEAHCTGCGSGGPLRAPIPVGQFQANAFGLFDTAGNVMEWVRDCYRPSYEGAPVDGGAWEDSDCRSRVARGGAFSTSPGSLRISKRDHYDPSHAYDDIGFRVVREP